MLGFPFAFNFSAIPWGIAAGVGIALGAVVAYFATREYIKQTIAVLQQTIKSHEANLKAKDELALSLAETYKQHVASLEAKLAAMTDERDNYRQQLHDTRDPMQALTLENQALKLRPDLNAVLQKEEAWHTRREIFYADMAANQKSIIETSRDTLHIIGEIKTNIEAEIKESNDVCAAVGRGLQDVLSGMADRDYVLTEIRDLLKAQASKSEPATKSESAT